MSVRSPTRFDARGVPIVFPTQSTQQSPRRRRKQPLSRPAASPGGGGMDEIKLCQVRSQISTPARQDRSLLNEHDEFTDACHRSHLNHISRIFFQGSPQGGSSPNSWQDISTEPIPTSARASPTSPATQHRQRRSPYGSPFQRLDAARRTRSKHPWISPTRDTTGAKRPIDTPHTLNMFTIPELANQSDQSPPRTDNKTTKKRRTLDFGALENNTTELAWPASSMELQHHHQFAGISPTQSSSLDQGTKYPKIHLPTPLSQPATTQTNHITPSNSQHDQIPSPFIESKRKSSQIIPSSPLDEDMLLPKLELDNKQLSDTRPDDLPADDKINIDDTITVPPTGINESRTILNAPINNLNTPLDPSQEHQNHQPPVSSDCKQQPLPKIQDENEILHQSSQQQQHQPDHEQQTKQHCQKQPLEHATDNQHQDALQNCINENLPELTVVEDRDKGVAANTTTAEEDKAKIDQQLVKKQILQQEIDALTKSVKLLRTHYQLVDKIGCGTFSSVYRALDIRYDTYDNSSWDTSSGNTVGEGADLQKSEQKRYVALKQIYATSSPKRMAQEIKILQHLRGAPCVSQLITAFRQHEHVFLVMPYFRHNDFKDCYRSMTMLDTKYYLKALLTALKHLHDLRILHRDIKPNNFLYNIELKTGMLIDFGLAQREEETRPPEPPKSSPPIKLHMARKPIKPTSPTSPTSSKQKQTPTVTTTSASPNSQPLQTEAPTSPVTATATKPLKSSTANPTNETEDDRLRKPGYIKHDPRKSVRASRAGTRGFRAPEVLLRVTHQTVAIDIWSVGVILLSLLSGRYPFFIAHDEGDSLIEIASIFGMAEMKDCAALHNRTFETNIGTIPSSRRSFSKLCMVLNTEKFKLWAEDDKQKVDYAVDLVEKMLALDYRARITAEDALKHPFLSDSHP